jgi:protein-L-isoaspartate O-methyltransferase
MYQPIKTIAMISLITISPPFAATFTFHQALEGFYKKSKPTMPQAESDGRTPTLNKKGAISPTLDYATLSFLDFAHNKRVLEIGGAYGNVMLEALKQDSSTVYHLNDLDERHLGIAAFRLQEKIDQRQICVAGLGNVQFIYGDITQTTWKVDKPYDAILMTNVMRFLTPTQIEHSFKNLFESLASGGRIFISATTPYVNRFKSFIPEYQRRLKQGDPYPGFLKNMSEYDSRLHTSPNQLNSTPDGHFMFLDDAILTRFCKNAGFKVLECTFKPLSYSSEMWELDGRETVILIAEKP